MSRPADFLADGGQVGARLRAHYGSASPLGDPATWPQSLRTIVGLLLQSRFPMFVAWGKDLGFLYTTRTPKSSERSTPARSASGSWWRTTGRCRRSRASC